LNINPDNPELDDAILGAPTSILSSALSALRGLTGGLDIARFLSDVPPDVDAFDYYGQMTDKIPPVMADISADDKTPDNGLDVSKGVPVMDTLEASKTTSIDRVLAIMSQDMASFGARSGEDELNWRRDGARPIDFYA
jgi:hypothetical protein